MSSSSTRTDAYSHQSTAPPVCLRCLTTDRCTSGGRSCPSAALPPGPLASAREMMAGIVELACWQSTWKLCRRSSVVADCADCT